MCDLLRVCGDWSRLEPMLTFDGRIISVMDGSLPKKPCKTCKNRFHAGCLYKVCTIIFVGDCAEIDPQWFNTSHSSSCPLCRSDII